MCVTDASGGYRFDEVPSGAYRLRVTRLGYRQRAVDVEVVPRSPLRVGVGLVVEPIDLEALAVVVEPAALRPVAPDERPAPLARIEAERGRRSRYLEPDVHAVTGADLLESVTLGEVDLMRALQRFPGVAPRDDWSAELRVRGAPWGRTEVRYDGVPLYNPLHVGGVLGAIPAEAVGAVFFHAGARPAALGGGGAALVDVASRSAGTAATPTSVHLDALNARAAGGGRFRDGRLGVMVTAHRSLADVLFHALADVGDGPDDAVDYWIEGGTARADWALGEHTRLTASGLREKDHVEGDLPGALTGTHGAWGNEAVSIALDTRVGARPLRASWGRSRYDAHARIRFEDGGPSPDPDARPIEPFDSRVSYDRLGVSLASDDRLGLPAWTLGAEVVREGVTQGGGVLEDGRVLARGALDGTLDWGALYADATWSRGALDTRAGMRLESDGAPGGDVLHVAPSVAARLDLGAGAYLSGAWGRGRARLQAIEGTGTPFAAELHASQLWVPESADRASATTDVLTLGADVLTADGWTWAVTAYDRRGHDVAILDPTPGPRTGAGPGWAPAETRARGVELSVRRLVGRVTGSVAYTLGHARVASGGVEFAAPGDRERVLTAVVSGSATPTLRLGVALTGASGASFTRAFLRYCQAPRVEGRCPTPGGGPAPWYQAPGAERGPGYESVDLIVDWTRPGPRWSWGLYATLRDVLGRDNRSAYVESTCEDDRYAFGRCASGVRTLDVFASGITFPLPLIGLRVVF